MFTESCIVYYRALTPLHPGTGVAVAAVDLPIQRERHTDFPMIQGSSLKGVFRGHWQDKGLPDLKALFGPDTTGASDHAGALAFADARVLLFPVRSLKGVYALVTCPLVLERWRRDIETSGFHPPSDVRAPGKALSAHVAHDETIVLDGKTVVIEELAFDSQTKEELKSLGEYLAKQTGFGGISKRLILLHNDAFAHLVRHATDIQAQIQIDRDKGTTTTGSLRHIEYLPAETIMYSLVLATKDRSGEDQRNAGTMIESFARHAAQIKTLQLGGNATTGAGFVELKLSKKGGQ